MTTPLSSMMLAVAVALVSLAVLNGPADARTQGMHVIRGHASYEGWKRAYLALPAEKRKAYDRLMEEYGASVAPKRAELKEARMELNRLERDARRDSIRMRELAARIDGCRQNLLALRSDLNRQVWAQTGLKPPYFHQPAGANRAP